MNMGPSVENEITDNADRHHRLLFGVRRSVRYHNRRRMFFDTFGLFRSAFSVILGSATMVGVLTKAGEVWILSSAAIITVFSAIDLVVGTAKAARLHSDLARRFIELEREFLPEKAWTRSELDRLEAARLSIEADEPPILRVLDSMCHNELLRAMGYDEGMFLNIRWYQRLAANIMDVAPSAIRARKSAHPPAAHLAHQ